MSIEFHCEHCSKLVKAPPTTGGKRAKCPYCQNMCYVPMPPEEIEEVPLVPLDEEEERHRKEALRETAALQQRLSRDRPRGSEKRETGAGVARRSSGTSSDSGSDSGSTSPSAVKSLVIAFVESMAAGRLDRADQIVAQLKPVSDQVNRIIAEVASDQLAAAEMPAVPRPVLMGFLKQLGTKL